MLPGASLSSTLWIWKHTVLEIFGKKHSSAGAVLKGTVGHLRARGKSWQITIVIGFETMTQQSRHQSGEKKSHSTFCCTISSFRFGWERLSCSAYTLSARQAMCNQVPVLSNALRMGKHTVLEAFDKKHSSADAVLKGTAGHNMWARTKSL